MSITKTQIDFANELQKYAEEQSERLMQSMRASANTTFHDMWQTALKDFSGQVQYVAEVEAEQATMRPVAPPELEQATKAQSMWLAEEEEAPADWARFSEVFGFAPPSGNDRKGPVYEPASFTPGLRSFIPAFVDGYFMPPEETEALWNAHIDGDVVWLHGLSGTGKSSLEEQFCAHIGQPFLRFNGREDIESSALFGQLTVESGEHGGTVWKDGLLTEGVRHGARVLLDEATLIPAGIMMGLQWLLEDNGKLMLTDKPAEAGDRLVIPDPRFRLTFADNTRGQGDDRGQFNGTGIINTATLNRVGLTLEIFYLQPKHELQVLQAQFGKKIHETVLKDIIIVANSLRKAMRGDQISLAFSLRSIKNVLTKAYNYRTLPVDEALRRGFAEGYANLLPNDDERDAAFEIFNLTFSTY